MSRRFSTFTPAIAVAAVAMVLAASGGCAKKTATSQSGQGTPAAAASMTPVARGEHLVKTMACNDCHTPWKLGANGPEPDMTRMLSGHPAEMKMPPAPDLSGQPWQWVGAATMTAFAGPWGVSYAANLTPDVTGTASWTEDQFIQVMRSGKIYGGARPIMPPMPWQGIANLDDDDLKAMFAYLQSLPPISNLVPAYEPPAGAMGAMGAPGGSAAAASAEGGGASGTGGH